MHRVGDLGLDYGFKAGDLRQAHNPLIPWSLTWIHMIINYNSSLPRLFQKSEIMNMKVFCKL